MSIIALNSFSGIAPRTDPAFLPQNGAQVAQDVRLHAGAIRAWRGSRSIGVTVPATTQSIFYDQGSERWFSWDTDVDCVLGPVADDDDKRRYYYTGDGTPKKTDSAMAIAGTGRYPQTYYELGVPAPAAAATASAGTGTMTRVWVYTNVSLFSGIEEEGAPSPPVTIATWASGDTITIDAMSDVPTTGYNVTKRRLYRSNGGAYQFVKEFTGTSTTDGITDEQLAEEITSTNFDVPPVGLKGLVSLANGILAGFIGNSLYFSAAYQPHAWPSDYALTVADKIVALVPIAQGMYVLTTGKPYYCSGMTPDSMSTEQMSKNVPCLSKRSASTDGVGAIYVTYNGIAHLSGATASNTTRSLFTQEEWIKYDTNGMHGIFYDERYTLWYTRVETDYFVMDGAFTMGGSMAMDGSISDAVTVTSGLVMDTTLPEAPMTTIRIPATAAHIITSTGKLYLLWDDKIVEFDADLISRSQYEWKSKLFVLPRPMNFTAVQVLADHDPEIIALETVADNMITQTDNASKWAEGAYSSGWGICLANEFEWNGSSLTGGGTGGTGGTGGGTGGTGGTPRTRFLAIRIYADQSIVFQGAVNDNKPIRLPSGFRSDTWEIAISGNIPVRRIVMATTVPELAQA